MTVGRRPLSEVVSSGEPSGEPAPGAGHTMRYRQRGRAQWLVLPVVLLRGVRRAYLPHGHEGLCAEQGSTKSFRGRRRWVEFTWPDGVPTLLLAPIPRLGVRLRGCKAWFVSRPAEAMHQVVQ